MVPVPNIFEGMGSSLVWVLFCLKYGRSSSFGFLIWGAVLVSVVFFNFKLKLVSIFSEITLSFR